MDQARTALAEHFGAFTLDPVSRDGKATYLVHGKLDFFGDEAMARTGGAGGGKWTERLPVRFKWLAAALENASGMPGNCQKREE